jgi:hypothetical protein
MMTTVCVADDRLIKRFGRRRLIAPYRINRDYLSHMTPLVSRLIECGEELRQLPYIRLFVVAIPQDLSPSMTARSEASWEMP